MYRHDAHATSLWSCHPKHSTSTNSYHLSPCPAICISTYVALKLAISMDGRNCSANFSEAAWLFVLLDPKAATVQGLGACLEATMHIKGLLEMMFDKLAGWIDEFIADMEVGLYISWT